MNKKTQKKIIKVVLIFGIISVFTAISEKKDSILEDGNVLRRNSAGKGDYEVDLIWSIPGVVEKQKVTVNVAEQGLSDEEAKKALAEAKKEIDDTFPAENSSVNEIREDVYISSSYQQGAVAADWSFDSYKFIDFDGKIYNENVAEEGELVKASVQLQCGEKTENYEFYFLVCPPKYTETQEIEKKLKQELINENTKTEEEKIILPDFIDGKAVNWSIAEDKNSVKIMIFGIIVAIFIPLIDKSREKENENKRKQMLQMEYAEVVSKLSILVGAGMTVFMAWNKIATDYDKKRKNNTIIESPVYEEMLITCHEVESGVSEKRAIERFGERCGIHLYRKFCSLLIQNLQKGTRGLTVLLENEVADAFEERKNLAKKYGEEAGTKMLFPMMIMLAIVMVIIMVPALISL